MRSLKKKLQKQAEATVMKLMADERTRPAVAKAMQSYMSNRQRVERIRAEALEVAGLARVDDVSRLRGRLRRLDRRLKRLESRIGELAG